MVRPMVHSTKHYVQNSIATVVGGADLNLVILESVATADKVDPDHVEEGNSVKAIYFEQWIRSAEAAAGSFVFTIEKIPAGGTFPSPTSMAALQDYDNKKNIFYTSQGLVNDVDADATPVVRNWLKIPKSKQRMGLGDKIILSLFAQGAIDLHLCGFATFKEYS